MANTPTTNFAIPKPAAGDINWEDEYSQFADLVDSRLMMGGMKNFIINGNFDIWQRGTSFTGISEYTSDRWLHNHGGSATISMQTFTLGQTDVPGNPRFYLRHDRTVLWAALNTVLQQRIEGVNTLAGETVRVSFYAKADAAKTLKVLFVQVFGTGGTPSANVETAKQDVSLTTSWQKFKLSFSIPSIFGKTLGTNNDDNLQLSIQEDTPFSAFVADFSQVQVEKGSVATDFELRPAGLELKLAQRYFERHGGVLNSWPFASAYQAAGSNYFLNVQHCFEKRTTPTVTKNGTWTTTNCGQPAVGNVNKQGYTLFAAPTVTGAFSFQPSGASDYIDVDAEF